MATQFLLMGQSIQPSVHNYFTFFIVKAVCLSVTLTVHSSHGIECSSLYVSGKRIQFVLDYKKIFVLQKCKKPNNLLESPTIEQLWDDQIMSLIY